MASGYVIQVVRLSDRQTVEWAPGQACERDLVTELANRVAAKGVGVGRTTAHVVADVQDALLELLLELKTDVPPLMA